MLDGFKPRYESTVTANLWADGAVMLGKLNMDEFAMGSSNETSYYGPVVNPWRRSRVDHQRHAGDAYGRRRLRQRRRRQDRAHAGQPAAGARRLVGRLGRGGVGVPVRGATATDTGGSIRQPAAFTGTVGIKPTYGRCSRWGIVAFASSLDQAGPIARDVRDAAILLKSMASRRSEGHDLRRPPGAGLRGGDRPLDQGHAGRHSAGNTASTACRRRSRRSGRRASPG